MDRQYLICLIQRETYSEVVNLPSLLIKCTHVPSALID